MLALGQLDNPMPSTPVDPLNINYDSDDDMQVDSDNEVPKDNDADADGEYEEDSGPINDHPPVAGKSTIEHRDSGAEGAEDSGYDDQGEEEDDEDDGSYADEEYGKKKAQRKKKAPSSSVSRPRGDYFHFTFCHIPDSFIQLSLAFNPSRILTLNMAPAPRKRRSLGFLEMKFEYQAGVVKSPTTSTM
jgi:hypothetical protein